MFFTRFVITTKAKSLILTSRKKVLKIEIISQKKNLISYINNLKQKQNKNTAIKEDITFKKKIVLKINNSNENFMIIKSN